MVALTSKIILLEKGCKIFKLTKVNLLFLVEKGLHNICCSSCIGVMVGGILSALLLMECQTFYESG